jgi:hypothetical protein
MVTPWSGSKSAGMMRQKCLILGLGLALATITGAARADNFLLRGFTWFGYLEGKELREACAPGAPDWLRFVYNGVYQEQVRVYEARRQTPAESALVSARVLTRLNLSGFRPSEIFLGTRDPRSELGADTARFDALLAALRDDGFGQPVPKGLTLPSDGFYWVVSGCVAGQWHIQGWVHPTERFNALRFPAQLFALDQTGVAVNKPRAVDAGERMRARSGNQAQLDVQPAFDVRLTDEGVLGRMPGL